MFNISGEAVSNQLKVPTPSVSTVCALVFHEVNKKTVVTRHAVRNGTLTTGVPISADEVLRHCQRSDEHADNTQQWILPSNVLYHSASKMCWYTKAQKRPMWFRSKSVLRFNVWWPALLWCLHGRNLSLYALGNNQRPHQDTKVYRAPLMNIDCQGRVCLGSATLPENTGYAHLSQIEACIFDSNFSHLNGANPKHGEALSDDTSHIGFWRKRNNTDTKIRVKELHYLGKLNQIFK